MPEPESKPTRLAARGLAPLLVAIAAAAAYANSVGNGFVWDDQVQIVGNPALDSLGDIPKYFSRPYWLESQNKERLYRPITVTTFALDRAIGGRPVHLPGRIESWPFHLTNLWLHLAASLLVFAVCTAWGRRTTPLQAVVAGSPAVPLQAHWCSPPLVAALLFAVHPIHTDAVDSVVQRSEPLAAIGVLAALWAGWKSDQCGGLRRTGLLALAALSFAFGLGSKETAAVLPLLWLAHDAALGGPRRTWIPRIPKYVVAAAVAALYAGARLNAIGVLRGTEDGFGGSGLMTRAATMICVLADYLRLMVFPHPLCANYTVNVMPSSFRSSFTDTRVLVSLGILMVPVFAGLWARRRSVPVGTWLLWIPLGLLPVSHLVPFGFVEAERFCYLPSVGACVVLATLLLPSGPAPGSPSWLRIAAIGLLLLAGLLTTAHRNKVWATQKGFAEALIQDAPDNPFGFYYRGACLADEHRYSECVADFSKALDLEPDYVNARVRRADAWVRLHKYAEAAADQARLLKHNPRDWGTRILFAQARVSQASGMAPGTPRQKQIFEEALAAYTHVLEADRQRVPPALYGRGKVLFFLGRLDEAVRDFQELIRATPQNWQAYAELVDCHVLRGDRGEVERLLKILDESGHAPFRAWRESRLRELERVENKREQRPGGQPGSRLKERRRQRCPSAGRSESTGTMELPRRC